MHNVKRVAILMAGGTGERFWPLSQRDQPKQLLPLTASGRTLLEEALERIELVVGRENTYVVCGGNLSDSILKVIPSLAPRLLVEPAKRNTAGAVLWASAVLANKLGTEDLSLAVLPADHRIGAGQGFAENVDLAFAISETQDCLVTIGLQPTRPETGYGYMEVANLNGDAFEVERFTEKPDQVTAEAFLAGGRHLWNSGMFFWRLSTFLNTLRQVSAVHSEAYDSVFAGLKQGQTAEAEAAFDKLPNLSIDHALMEKAVNTIVVKAKFEWDDIGSLDTLSRILEKDGAGNAAQGDVRFLDCGDSVVYNALDGLRINLLGTQDLVVVAANGEIVVCPKGRAQDVKKLTE